VATAMDESPAAKWERIARKRSLEERADRYIADKLVGHLHTAAQALVEGQTSTAEKMRHEVKEVMHLMAARTEEGGCSGVSLATLCATAAGASKLALPNAVSIERWSESVERLIPVVKELSTGTGRMPASIKRYLGDLIRQGKVLCDGANSVMTRARSEMREATKYHAALSGRGYF
jgi:hypothetical protein